MHLGKSTFYSQLVLVFISMLRLLALDIGTKIHIFKAFKWMPRGIRHLNIYPKAWAIPINFLVNKIHLAVKVSSLERVRFKQRLR